MIDETNKNELIEKYLLGELRGDYLDAFNEKLVRDPGFRKEVALERALIRNLKTAGRARLRTRLEGFHQEMGPVITPDEMEELDLNFSPPENKSIKLYFRKYAVLAAASIALLLACTLTLRTFYLDRSNPDILFESYYEPYEAISVMRDIPTKTAIKNEAALAYNERNYRKSIQLFKIVLEKEKDEEALFYLGNAYLSANMPSEAINTFEAYLREFEGYRFEAKWYLSLSYLKADKDQKARKLLKELATEQSPENPYRDKAREILRKLDAE